MDDSYGKASVASTALAALSAVTEKRLVKKNTIGLCRNGKAQLANLSNKRRRLHRRITGLLLICGVIMTIGGLAVDMLFEGGLFGEQQKTNALYFQIAWTTGTTACFSQSCQPTRPRYVSLRCTGSPTTYFACGTM